jgi:four helix bundle protein
MDKTETFEDLKCWQAAYGLKRRLWNEVIKAMPKQERFELYSQILRAARSATSNIAEGWGRFHFLDSRRFYYNSRGSLSEILDHLIEARDLEYISEESYQSLRLDTIRAIKILNGYIRYLKKEVER